MTDRLALRLQEEPRVRASDDGDVLRMSRVV